MAYIHSFRVDGLAGREAPVERALTRGVNVFWGLNGSGKTSLLRVLHAALDNDARSLSSIPFTGAWVVFWSDKYECFVRRTLVNGPSPEASTIDEDGQEWVQVAPGEWEEVVPESAWATETGFLEDDNFVPAATDESKLPWARLDGRFIHTYLPISRLSEIRRPGNLGLRRPTATQVVDDHFLDEQFADNVQRRWQDYNTTALGEVRAIQQQGLASILEILFGASGNGSRASAIDPGAGTESEASEAYVSVRNFLGEQGIRLGVGRPEFLRRYREGLHLREVVSSIEATTARVEQALEPQREFVSTVENLFSGSKSLVIPKEPWQRPRITVQIGDSSVPLQSLSSGEKQLLRLMLEVLAAGENSVLIDEPEISMHVDWQLVLVESMRRINPNCQLLLATHSPDVMAHVSPELVFQI